MVWFVQLNVIVGDWYNNIMPLIVSMVTNLLTVSLWVLQTASLHQNV